MKSFPLCTRLLNEVHSRLLKGTRGEEKTPGEVRVSQNWIGPAGCVLREAPYVPPNVDDMAQALGDLDLFINNGAGLDPIVKAALIHYHLRAFIRFLMETVGWGALLITLSLINDGRTARCGVFTPFVSAQGAARRILRTVNAGPRRRRLRGVGGILWFVHVGERPRMPSIR